MRLLTLNRLLAGALAVAAGGVLVAQPPSSLPGATPIPADKPIPVDAPKAEDEDVQVLARGPIHEAFATTAEFPTASPVLDKRPPDPVEELPPDTKPEGDNVQWLPGYWHFDEDRKDFIWISGFWRNAPAGRVWVPGDWREAKGGWQWVPGFWYVADKQQVPAEIEYLPPPPVETLEAGPSVVSPSADCFYTPGCWVYSGVKYKWRPGFWVEHRRDWVWVPDHYRWTPCGYVFIAGYWDCPLATRGVLFAPVYFRPAVFERRRYVYTPVYAVPDTSLQTCLFVRGGYSSYYFGDYYEPRYATAGYSSWCGVAIKGSNFAVGVAYTRQTYDPLWSYYAVEYRSTPAWQTNITTVYAGRYKGDVPRPPTTLIQQNIVQQNVVNVTNVTNVTNVKNVSNQTMLAPVATLSQHSSQPITLAKVSAEDRKAEQTQAKEIRQVAAERRKVETAIVDKGLVVTKDDKPRTAKLEVPKTVALRAQLPADTEKAPPPAATAAKKPDPAKVVPTTPPAKLPPPPVIDPKTGSVTPPKKVDPPVVLPPKVDPQMPDPKKPPVVVPPLPDPKKPVDPVKPPPTVPTTPPKVDPPKVDPPKLPPVVPPVTPPKVDPPKVDPPKLPPVVPPKVDPPKPPVTPPTPPRKNDPPKKEDPPKKDDKK